MRFSRCRFPNHGPIYLANSSLGFPASVFVILEDMSAHESLALAPEPPTELGRYRILSSTAGVRVSPLCLGALSIGSAWRDVGTCNAGLSEHRFRNLASSSSTNKYSVARQHEQGSFLQAPRCLLRSWRQLHRHGGKFDLIYISYVILPRHLTSLDQNNYQDEQSETWLGDWMMKRNNRDLLVIATK